MKPKPERTLDDSRERTDGERGDGESEISEMWKMMKPVVNLLLFMERFL